MIIFHLQKTIKYKYVLKVKGKISKREKLNKLYLHFSGEVIGRWGYLNYHNGGMRIVNHSIEIGV